jgi:acetyl-CoA carboxylase carboxyltransferase component
MYVEHNCTDFGMEKRPYSGRRRRHRLGHDQRPPGLCLLQDFTVFGGSLSERHAQKICKIMDMAMKVGAPVIGLNDSGRRAHSGRRRPRWRLCRGVPAQRAGLGRRAADQRHHGALRGRRVYSPAMTDFIFMVKDSVLHVRHRPRCGEDRDQRDRHAAGRTGRRGHAHHQVRRRRRRVRERHRGAARRCATLFDFLPLNNREAAAGAAELRRPVGPA